MAKKKGVMEDILTGDDSEFAGETRELDCLIYRGDEPDPPTTPAQPQKDATSWKVSKGPVTVETWEGKAKIRIKVGAGAASQMSMKRIASIAVDAIMAEIEKERS